MRKILLYSFNRNIYRKSISYYLNKLDSRLIILFEVPFNVTSIDGLILIRRPESEENNNSLMIIIYILICVVVVIVFTIILVKIFKKGIPNS